MDRTASSWLVSWLLVPVAAVLLQSALNLPRQAYTGLILRGDRVMGVDPGSPGERAGCRAGDRVVRFPGVGLGVAPFSSLSPGVPVEFELLRETERRRAWLVPDPLPDRERRLMSALLAVASVFVLLGGWVWSERRDPLARAFLLLCLSFAYLLAPLRRWGSGTLQGIDSVVLTGIEVFLPALFVHFFALFPESRARGRRSRWVRAAYTVSGVLFAPALLAAVLNEVRHPLSPALLDLLSAVAGAWFAVGLLTALALFGASYFRAASSDTRRRLRVALLGTALGVAPIAALIALRNLSPGTEIPGERWALLLALLVPISFAWATVVHRVFDFRVALRAGAMTLVLLLAGSLAFAAGEWVTAMWWPDLSERFAGGTLAFVALAASLAGPAAPWLGSIGARMVPGDGGMTLAAWISSTHAETRAIASDPAARERLVAATLGEACEVVTRVLRLTGALAMHVEDGAARVIARAGEPIRLPPGGLGIAFERLTHTGVRSADRAPLDARGREALEAAGAGWLLPIGEEPVRALLVLGRRLAGTWLSRRETNDLERFAAHLAVTLENVALHREARTRGALERELREAGAIQAHLLPRQAPVYPTLDCAAAALSSESVGGDYYDFVEGSERDLHLVVGDAAGKGMPAAILVSQVQSSFRSLAKRGLSPSQIMSTLNQDLVRHDQPEKFVGLLCARLEIRTGRLWVSNAGLTPPLIRRAAGAFSEVLSGGVLLGVSPSASYPDALVELDAGDLVVVYTDGLTEARCGEELFGTERVSAVLDRAHDRRAADILEELLAEVRSFADRPLDDLTVVVLKQLTRPATAKNGVKTLVQNSPAPADAEV